VTVAYAGRGTPTVVELDVPAGATVGEAIARSGLLAAHPDIDLAVNRVGVFGVLCDVDRVVEAHERVEIYRPLPVDPKEVRRRRARGGGPAGAGSKR